MKGTWSNSEGSSDSSSRTESNVGSWSKGQRQDSKVETTSKKLNQHLNIEGHDPRIQHQQLQEINDDSPNQSATQRQTISISRWWKHILTALFLSPVLFMLTMGAAILHVQYTSNITLTLMTIFALAFVASRLSLPIAMYRDLKKVRQSTVNWTPRSWIYVLGVLIVPPPMEFLSASVYLTRRYLAIGTPNFKRIPEIIRGKLEKHVLT